MRIAHIITRLVLGGAQENTILTCQGLIEQFSDEVLLISGPGLGPEGGLEADAKSRGIPIVSLPMLRRNINPWLDWKSYTAIKKAIADFSPDVVHTHSGKAGLLGRMAADALSIPCIIHTVHGAPFHAYQNGLARAFFRRCEVSASKKCHAIISVADAMTDQLVAANVAPREKFSTIYSGMETSPFLNNESLREPTREAIGFGPDDIVIAKVARLFHLKGHDDLINAATLAIAKEPKLKFLLVGDGILRGRIESAIHARGLDEHFFLTGLVPPDRIPALLSASDIVVHTSYREGLARVLPQAMLSQKPVISYGIDGAREVVQNGETGFLVSARDEVTLAERILELANNPELRSRQGRAGRLLCTERFDHRTMTQKIREVYENVLQKR